MLTLGKKGMSPLIATVLLIAFAVALGAMIMNWSSETEIPQNNPSKNTVSCDSVNIELNKVFDKTLFCQKDNNIKFNIVNTGSLKIDGIQLRTVDSDLKEVKHDLPGSSISVGDTYENEFPFDKIGKIHVELVPKVLVDGQTQYCVNQKIVRDILPECNN